MSEINTKDVGLSGVTKGESKVASSAAKVQNHGIGALKDRPEKFGCAGAPETIQFEGQKMIEQVVVRRDLREHLADFLRGVRFSNSALGPGSFHWRRNFVHRDFP